MCHTRLFSEHKTFCYICWLFFAVFLLVFIHFCVSALNCCCCFFVYLGVFFTLSLKLLAATNWKTRSVSKFRQCDHLISSFSTFCRSLMLFRFYCYCCRFLAGSSSGLRVMNIPNGLEASECELFSFFASHICSIHLLCICGIVLAERRSEKDRDNYFVCKTVGHMAFNHCTTCEWCKWKKRQAKEKRMCLCI